MVNFNINVKEIDINSIFSTMSNTDILEIVFYFYTNSPRREFYQKFFTEYDETANTQYDLMIYEEITNIFYIFAFAKQIIYDMNPLQLFTFIDTRFNSEWLSLLNYASERSYRAKYYAIAFVCAKYELLEDMDANSIIRNDLEEEYNHVLLEKEYNMEKIEELNSYIYMYEDFYKKM